MRITPFHLKFNSVILIILGIILSGCTYDLKKLMAELESVAPSTPAEPPVPPPTPLVLGSNVMYLYNHMTNGKIVRINSSTGSVSDVAQLANSVDTINTGYWATAKRYSTASATVTYINESNVYKTYRFDYATQAFTDLGSFGAWSEPYMAISDDSLIVESQVDGLLYFTKPTQVPITLTTAFGFDGTIGNISFSNNGVAPLGRNYFLVGHDGTNANKVFLLNANNMTKTGISIPGIVSINQIYTFTAITNEDSTMVYLEYYDGSNNVEKIYHFNQLTGTFTSVDTINPSTGSVYYYYLLPTRDGNYVYTRTQGGTYLINTINAQTGAVTLAETITNDPTGELLNNNNCSKLYTNLSQSRFYAQCTVSVWNNTTSVWEYDLIIHEVNLTSGAKNIYKTTTQLPTNPNSAIGMFRDNFYLIADVDGNGTNEFKKLILSGSGVSGTITYAATNEVENLLKQQVCDQLIGAPCTVDFNWSKAQIVQHNDPILSKRQAYEFMLFYFIGSGITAYQVTVNGTNYILSTAVIHNDDVYLPTPVVATGGMADQLALFDGVVWILGFFSNYLISNLWMDLF